MSIDTISNLLFWGGMFLSAATAVYSLEMKYREDHKDETLHVHAYWKKNIEHEKIKTNGLWIIKYTRT
ncbi:MAG: hypothetical protein Q7J54_06680 [Candidatus Woesearchaeota archaeon]|nr:hypothetical protein [Candidatus Woesearchaeota archaeon]